MKFARLSITLAVVFAVVTPFGRVQQARAIDTFFNKANSTWNTNANWSLGGIPQANPFNEVGVIGTTDGTGVVDGIAGITAPVATVAGGATLGQQAGTTGTLNISATGSLSNVGNLSGATGVVTVGQAGRGYLNMSGTSSLTAVNLLSGGESLTTGSGPSAINLSGSATINTGAATLGRNLRITGPNVNFNVTGSVIMQSSNSYTAEITSATTHSPIKAASGAIVGGGLSVVFNGVTPTAGQTWNLVDAFDISGGFNNLGTGGNVNVTGVPAPALGSAYRLKQAAGGTHGQLLQLSLEKLLVLRVDRDSGEISITNPLGGAVSIDSYTVSSPTAGSLLTGYKGISGAPAGDIGWAKFGISQNFLSEVKQSGTLDLSSVPSLTLGTGFSKTAVAANAALFGTNGEDLVFEYSFPDNDVVRGQVQYVGTAYENNLVLTINTSNGAATLKNDTLTDLSFDGYEIHSTTGALTGTPGWTGIGGQWEKSPSTANSLTETNPHGPLTLASGASVPLGNIGAFGTLAAQQGISLQFLRYVQTAVTGDYNNNGTVDAADYVLWRNGGPLQNDPTAGVQPGDYTVWRQNFGNTGGGLVGEDTFRIGTVRFTSGSGAGTVLMAVPEPSATLLLIIGLAGVSALGPGAVYSGRRRFAHAAATTKNTGQVQVGVQTMSRKIGIYWALVFGVAAAVLAQSPAAAQVQGITVANPGFELPGGGKVVPFDATGNPIAPDAVGGIPGWTFTGLGTEVFFNGPTPTVMGDSSTEAVGANPAKGVGANPSGQRLTLSTLDGKVFQSTGHNALNISANQSYRVSFDAYDAFTINNGTPQNFTEIEDRARLTVRLYDGTTQATIATKDVDLAGFTWQNFELRVPGGTPGLVSAVGHPIGIEFDTTSIERNQGTMFDVGHSWVSYDNVLLQITGALPGDLDGDGDRDIFDYRIIRDRQQLAGTYLFQGELNGDGIVNLNDFRAWTKIVGPLPGVGLGTIDGIPEPTTMVLAVLVAAALAAVRSRRRHDGLRRTGLLVAAIAAAAGLLSASPAKAVLLAYDPFLVGSSPAAGEYSAGALAGQSPTVGIPPTPAFFTGAWVIGSAGADVIVTSLAYEASTSLGGSVDGNGNAGGRTGRFLATPWNDSTVGTFYVGFQVNFGTIAGSQDSNMGYRAVELWPDDETVLDDAGRTDIGYNQYNLHDQPASQGNAATAKMFFDVKQGDAQERRGIIPGAPDSYNDDGDVHLILLKYVLTDAAGGDSISLILDPPKSPVEPAPNLCFDGTGADVCMDNATVTPAALDLTLETIGSGSNFGGGAAGSVFDELRVATTYAEAMPTFPVPGDTDNDGDVDLIDYANITNNYNQSPTDTLHGDVTGDQFTGIADFRVWKDNYPFPGGGSGAVSGVGIPEPWSLTLALAATSAVAGWARPQRRRARHHAY